MIVKNEERNLARCLDSVRALASDLILVDTGSTDSTPLIAARYGARVIPFDFTLVDFAAARNRAIEDATGRWILVLDADETLDPAGIPELEALIALDDTCGYFLERHNHSSDPTVPANRDYVVRLFPNRPGYRYRGRVHETIDAAILAAEYHQLEMFDEATAVAERIAELRPLDPRAHLFAGVYHLLYKPDLPRARADFTQALKLKPGYAEAEAFLQRVNEQEAAQSK